jgi:pimeloyl-ACP methyl ester carboxylesterase
MLDSIFCVSRPNGSVPPETYRIASHGLSLHVRDAGSGRPVLLLHGFPDSAALWDPVTPHMVAAGRRIIAPDLRGFGQSDAPAGTRC